ncbi:MAG: DUF1987 domain-containing protein [Nitrospirae bacterium]|nr:DUF1987 domain-containing protein [Nitrospirota bacterium]
MDKFYVAATRSTPYIKFDPPANTFIISGESYPENAAMFYTPVFAWLTEFFDLPDPAPITFDLELIYFNSSSSKALMNLFTMLERLVVAGKDITVNWRYYADNDTALECGEEFMEDAPGLKINLVEVERPE